MFEGQSEPPKPTSIDTAFDELSVQAFACWIRLMTIPGWELQLGRTYVASKLNVPVRTMNRYLTELVDKGYLRMIKQGGNKGTAFFIELAPMLVSPNHFVNYS